VERPSAAPAATEPALSLPNGWPHCAAHASGAHTPKPVILSCNAAEPFGERARPACCITRFNPRRCRARLCQPPHSFLVPKLNFGTQLGAKLCFARRERLRAGTAAPLPGTAPTKVQAMPRRRTARQERHIHGSQTALCQSWLMETEDPRFRKTESVAHFSPLCLDPQAFARSSRRVHCSANLHENDFLHRGTS